MVAALGQGRLGQSNNDALWLIFLYLPLKTLFRCKVVCKSWNSVISGPHFSSQYRRHCRLSSRHSYAGLFYLWVPGVSTGFVGNGTVMDQNEISEKGLASAVDLWRGQSPSPPVVLASSNGVLLCGRCKLLPDGRKKIFNFFVSNPFTREWVALPVPPRAYDLSIVGFRCRDGASSSAYLCRNYEYEVLRVLWKKDFLYEVQSYCSKSCKWTTKLIPSGVPVLSKVDAATANIIAGVFYWIMMEAYKYYIISYDTVSCQLEEVPLPPDDKRRNRSGPLSVGEGAGGVLLCYDVDDKGFDIWARISDKGKTYTWQRKHRVEWTALDEQSRSLANAPIFSAPYNKYYVKALPEDPEKVFIGTCRYVFFYNVMSGELGFVLRDPRPSPDTLDFCHPYHIPSWYIQLH